jgi:hypothetical protein
MSNCKFKKKIIVEYNWPKKINYYAPCFWEAFDSFFHPWSFSKPSSSSRLPDMVQCNGKPSRLYWSPDTPEGCGLWCSANSRQGECRKELGRYENIRTELFLGVRAHAKAGVKSNLRPKFPEWGPFRVP